jgi:hypothetical protein
LERAPRGKKLPKDCPTAKVLIEAEAAALHPERYQSLLSKLKQTSGIRGVVNTDDVGHTAV